MGWWIGAIFFGILQLVWILAVMAGVFRKKEKVWSKNSMMGLGIHGTFAVLSLWMCVQAVN